MFVHLQFQYQGIWTAFLQFVYIYSERKVLFIHLFVPACRGTRFENFSRFLESLCLQSRAGKPDWTRSTLGLCCAFEVPLFCSICPLYVPKNHHLAVSTKTWGDSDSWKTRSLGTKSNCNNSPVELDFSSIKKEDRLADFSWIEVLLFLI